MGNDMLVRSFSVRNFKCFSGTPTVLLDPKMTVIIGRNNAGKTALLHALSVRGFGDYPFRYAPTRLPHSRLVMEIEFTPIEISREVFANNNSLGFPVPVSFEQKGAEYWEMLATKGAMVTLVSEAGRWHIEKFAPRDSELIGVPDRGLQMNFNPATLQVRHTGGILETSPLADELGKIAQSKTYLFDAERPTVPTAQVTTAVDLANNASNLAAVLHNVHITQHRRFQEYVEAVRDILPEIKHIGLRMTQAGNPALVEVLIWETEEQEIDWAMRLADCGSGVGQVLALMYVALFVRDDKTILIDEPNSFLHPGASRRLLEMLGSLHRHQFIISTHSADGVNAADPGLLYLVKRAGDVAREVVPISRDDIGHLRLALGEIGARLSDVFGADAIIWVEGQTEEIAFPLLLSAAGVKLPRGVIFLALISVGELESERHNPSTLAKIYRRLSESSALLPPSLAFSFDDEGRTQDQKRELRTTIATRVEFLPRRSYENYLIVPKALTEVFSQLPSFSDAPLSETAVLEAIVAAAGTPKLLNAHWHGDIADADWLRTVDAPRLLTTTLLALSETGEEYRKTQHSVALTAWLLANARDELNELVEYVKNLVDAPTQH